MYQSQYNMTQRGPNLLLHSKSPFQTKESSQVNYNPFMASKNPLSFNATPHNNMQISPLSQIQRSQSKRLSSADVGRITGSSFREGQHVKGQSRISYVPYEKKIIDYETRTYTQMRPRTKRIVDYQEKKVIQNVPRQVVRQQYYPVQKITQVCKEIVEMRQVEKKVKNLQYAPVEKQIVHYPENEDYNMVQGQSKIHLQNQGVMLKSNVEYRPIQSHLRYDYTGTPSKINMNTLSQSKTPARLVLSKSPNFANQSMKSSKVQVFKPNPSVSQIHFNGSRYIIQPEEFSSMNQKVQNRHFSRSKLLERYASSGKLSAVNYL